MALKRFALTYLAPAVLINAGNGCAYAFQVLLAHALSPADLGGFNAALSGATLLAAPAAVAPLAVTHMAALQVRSFGQAGYRAIVALTTWASLAGAALVAAACLAASPWLQPLLKLHGGVAATEFAALLALSLVYPVAAGWHQAQGRYATMSAVLGGVPILRLVFGLILVLWLGAGLNGALASAALSCLVMFLAGGIGLWPVPLRGIGPLAANINRQTLAFILPGVVTTLLVYALFNIDMILARAVLPEAASGAYAIAAVIGRIAFLGPAAIANALYGEMKQGEDQDAATKRRRFLVYVGVVGAIGLALAVAIAFFAEPLVVLMAGAAYLAAVPTLRVTGFAMAGLAVLNTVVVLGMTTRHLAGVLVVLAVGVTSFAAACLTLAVNAGTIALLLAASIYAMVPACALIVLAALRSGPQSTTGAPPDEMLTGGALH